MALRPAYPAPRPLGVAILAVLIGLVGAIFLLAAILILLAVGLSFAGSVAAFGVSTFGGLLMLVLGIVILVVAKGLWDQEMWALVLCLVVLILALLSDLVRGAFGLGAVLLLVLIIYLAVVHREFT